MLTEPCDYLRNLTTYLIKEDVLKKIKHFNVLE